MRTTGRFHESGRTFEVPLLQFYLGAVIAAKAQHAIPKSDERTRLFRTNPSSLLPLTRMLSAACGYLSGEHEKGGPQAAF
jgi:hypothetical protein